MNREGHCRHATRHPPTRIWKFESGEALIHHSLDLLFATRCKLHKYLQYFLTQKIHLFQTVCLLEKSETIKSIWKGTTAHNADQTHSYKIAVITNR